MINEDEKKFLDYIKAPLYQVWLKAVDDADETIKSDVGFISSEIGLEILFKIFRLIKAEIIGFTSFDDVISDSEQSILQFLYQQLRLEDFDEKNSVEQAILERIKALKEYKYWISLKEIENMLRDVRGEKIKIWKTLYHEYSKKKEFYDRTLREQLDEREREIRGYR